MIGGAIVLDYHKGSAMAEMDDPRVRLGGGYIVSEAQPNTSTIVIVAGNLSSSLYPSSF